MKSGKLEIKEGEEEAKDKKDLLHLSHIIMEYNMNEYKDGFDLK